MPLHRTRLPAVLLPLLVALPFNSARAEQGEQQHDFAAVDNAAILPANGLSQPQLQQRFYLPAIPAFPASGKKSSNPSSQPRGRFFQPRQDDSDDDDDDRQAIDCGDGSHNCLDAGPDGAAQCCPDTRYCFVGSDLDIHCCAIGNVCSELTPCSSGANYCMASRTVTTTITRSSPPPSSSSLPSSFSFTPTTEVLVTQSSFPACCNRPCGTDEFLCPAAFGGQCCAHGSRCGTSGRCLSEVAEATSATTPAVANPVPDGCSYTYQFSCDPADGAGCCATGQTCRSPTWCDGEPAAPTATGASGDPIVPVDDSNGGLSSGARAGVGIGVAVVVLAVATALVAFCLRRRSRRNKRYGAAAASGRGGGRQARTATVESSDELQQQQQVNGGAYGSGNGNGNNHRMGNMGGGGGFGGGGRVGTRRRDRFPMGPLSPVAQLFHRGGGGGGGGGTIDSEMSGPTSVGLGSGGGSGSGSNGGVGGGGRPQPHRTGLSYDYFGPHAVAGPYTEDANTPAASPPERQEAVAVRPQGPDDIVAPVEIDSRDFAANASPGFANEKSTKKGGGGGGGNEGPVGSMEAASHSPFELTGGPPLSMGSPSPPPLPPSSPGRTGEPRSLGAVSPSPEPPESRR